MFATPCYGGSVTSPYAASLYSLAGDCLKLGLESRLELGSESLIPRARNRLVTAFLQDESFTHLFFIDADILFGSTAVLRLLLTDKSVSVGVYPLKQMKESYPFFALKPETDEDGFCEVYPATTGFMCIKREVIWQMMDKYPDRRYEPDSLASPAPCFDLFPAFIEPVSRHYWSEDYGFCYLWHEIGGKVFADVHSTLSHYGQHLFKGDLAEHLGIQKG